MSNKLRNTAKELLISSLTDEENDEIRAYILFYEKYQEEISTKSREKLADHSVLGPIISSMSKEQLDENSKISISLQKSAVIDDEWDPYLDHLISQGIQYAKMGMSFFNWVEVVQLVRNLTIPYLTDEYEKDPEKTLSISRGMNRFLDIALAVIGEAYLHEKTIIIDNQVKEQDRLIEELESFAFVISHDLKTPMRGISQLSEWLLNDYKDKLDSTGQEYLRLLKNRVEKLYSLINGVLAYSRAGKEDGNREKIDVNKLIGDIKELINPDPKVKIRIANELPVVSAQKTTLLQTFLNLMSNAINHNDKETPEIEIGSRDVVGCWEFYVRDNGPGIDKKYRKKIFGMFQTLSSKPKPGSTGIGLAVIKKIIEKSHGKIWFESEEGKGTTFYFTLPKVGSGNN